MKKEVIVALISAMVEDAITDIKSNLPKGDRGPRGFKGESFDFEYHKDTISQIILDHISSLKEDLRFKYSDFSESELAQLRGKDGKDFIYIEHADKIQSYIDELYDSMKGGLKLKFSDLSEEEKLSLKGVDGKDGKDFLFAEHQESIGKILNDIISQIKNQLQLKFSDLTEQEIDLLKLKFNDLSEDDRQQLKGPRGQRGKQGKDFDFAEHQESIFNQILTYITEIRPELELTFDKLTQEQKDELTLTFNKLSQEEKDSLKLKFSDLTEEERFSLRGPRGQKGKKGDIGERGEKGEVGAIGPMGPRGQIGPQGLKGVDGINGRAGVDAPTVQDIEVVAIRNEIFLIFYFSDGSILETNKFTIPSKQSVASAFMVSTGSGGLSEITIEDEGNLVGGTSTLNFEGFTVTQEVDKITISNPVDPIAIYDEGNLQTNHLKSMDFIGDGVQVLVQTTVGDWVLLSDVEPNLVDYNVINAGHVKVVIDTPDSATRLSIRKVCGENMVKFRAASLTDSDTILYADRLIRPVVDGILVEDGNVGDRRNVVMFGIIEDASFTWPLKDKLFLDQNGQITNVFPPSGFMTVIGKSLGNGAIFIDIKEPEAL